MEGDNKKDTEKEMQKELEKYLFPYDSIRDVQQDMIEQVADSISGGNDLIVHAPTGLGKTVATLGPALKYAMENKKKIFFLTSRHTQHAIAIDTLREIKKKHRIEFVAVDLIGKKWMCTVPGVDKMRSGDFYEYCKKQRADGLCEQYSNTKSGNKLTTEGKLALKTLKQNSPAHIEEFTDLCGKDNLCAHELATTLAKEANVIVADYYYIFNPWIRDQFFNKSDILLSDCIVVVDEAHNLPDRMRTMMTIKLSNYTIKRAVTESKKVAETDIVYKLSKIQDILNEFSQDMRNGDEKNIRKQEFINKISKIGDYDDIIADFTTAASRIKETEKQSSLITIAEFLDKWNGSDTGYVRIISQKKTHRESLIELSYRCLDPAIITKDTINNAHSTILMSGTLTPTAMYKDLLGFGPDTIEARYSSPFPEENRLSMIIPDTTTKFSSRNPQMYERIAQICAEVTNRVPGNTAIFFPSYFLRDRVYEFFEEKSKKTAFVEHSEMNKEEKTEFLNRFKSYKDSGAVLLGVVSGSFGEGIDLPGDLLKSVVVVGLPLQQPTLETKALIDYYDKKFSKGWDYGYVGPAFSKCMQSAGRCIRSENDRGIVVFLDERYTWPNYFKHFPIDMDIKITKLYADRITEFFG